MKAHKRTARRSKDALAILDARYFTGKARMERILAEERSNDAVARQIYRMRTEADLTQAQLATRIGTTASVISRLEDTTYRGHSLTMLQRVAAALGRRVEMRFVQVR